MQILESIRKNLYKTKLKTTILQVKDKEFLNPFNNKQLEPS